MSDATPGTLRTTDLLVAAGITGACLALWVWMRQGLPVTPWGMDGTEWVTASVALATGDTTAFGATWRPAGYPALVAAASLLGAPPRETTILAPMGFAALTVGLTYLSGVVVAGRGAALLAAWIVACAPGTADAALATNSQACFDMFVAALIGLGVWAHGGEGPDSRNVVAGAYGWASPVARWALIGLLCGLAATVKETGLPLLLVGVNAAAASGASRAAPGSRVGGAVRAALGFFAGAAGPTYALVWTNELRAVVGAREDKFAVMTEDFVGLLRAEDWRVARIRNQTWRPPGTWTLPGPLGLVLYSTGRSLWILLMMVGSASLLAVGALWRGHRRVGVLACLLLLLPLAPAFLVSVYPWFHFAFAAAPISILSGLTIATLVHRIPAPTPLGTRGAHALVWGAAALFAVVPLGARLEQGGPVRVFDRTLRQQALAAYHPTCNALTRLAEGREIRSPLAETARLREVGGGCATIRRVTPTDPAPDAPFLLVLDVADGARVPPPRDSTARCDDLWTSDPLANGRRFRVLKCEPSLPELP